RAGQFVTSCSYYVRGSDPNENPPGALAGGRKVTCHTHSTGIESRTPHRSSCPSAFASSTSFQRRALKRAGSSALATGVIRPPAVARAQDICAVGIDLLCEQGNAPAPLPELPHVRQSGGSDERKRN